MNDVTIVGAGIAGLSLAYYLEKQGINTLVIDSADHIGGWIQSSNTNEHLIELGPNSTINKKDILDLVTELGIDNEVVYPDEIAKKRYLALPEKNNQQVSLTAVPTSPVEALTSNILSTKGKLRILKEPLIKRQYRRDESVASFFTRRFGKEVLEHLVAPMLSGIWAANVEKLSIRTALPIIWKLEQQAGSVILGGIKRKKKKNGPSHKMLSFRKGMKTLPEALANKISHEKIQLNTALDHYKLCDERVLLTVNDTKTNTTSIIPTKHLVLTCDAKQTSKLTQDLFPTLHIEMAKMPYAPIGILHLSYKKKEVKHKLDGFGFLVPPKYASGLLGAIFSSSIFPQRAPEDRHLITCFCGGSLKPEMSRVDEARVRETIINNVSYLLGIESDPLVLNSRYIENAIPNYPLNHHKLQENIRMNTNNNPNLSILGNWAKGISVADRVTEARKLSHKIIEGISKRKKMEEEPEGD